MEKPQFPRDFLMRRLLILISFFCCLAVSRRLAASTEGLLQIAGDIHTLAKQYATVIDEPSAIQAAPRIKAQYDKLFQAIDEALAQRAKDPDKVYSDEERARVNAAMSQSEEALLGELKRVDRLQNLPAEFWDVGRVGTFGINWR